MTHSDVTDPVLAFHASIDKETRRLHVVHVARLQCKQGCSACCVDELSVFDVEAARIRRHHGALLATGIPHAEGGCAFLDREGSCRIYADRPYVCRTQGLPLRWVDEEQSDPPTELRDICPLNETSEPIELLRVEDCWTLGPREEELARMQMTQTNVGASAQRVLLRGLFVLPAAAKAST